MKFKATSASGRVYTITQRVERSPAIRDFEGNSVSGGGFIILETAEGYVVNRLDKGKYEVVDTGETVTSADPNAP